jgi:hypothetical protein
MIVNTIDLPARSTETATNGPRQCVFCREEIRPGASVCPHCGSTLAPLQAFADRQTALEQRLAALEQALATLRVSADAAAVPAATATEAADPALGAGINWPHMADNIFLGLATLLAAHWVAATLPASGRAGFRLVALAVALPFGFRFERHARTGTSGQVIAAISFGCSGTLAIGLLDMVLGGHGMPTPTAEDIVASVAAITLSHFAGSAWAYLRRSRAERRSAAAARADTPAQGSRERGSLMHIEPAQIKGTAEAVKALYEAVAPLAAGAAALWAAFGHLLF